MSTIRVNGITDRLGTGAPDFPNGIAANGITVNGACLLNGTVSGNAVATETEAVTGTDNTKLMTPLRAAQSVSRFVPDVENRIINGAFDFWQRGTSFTTNAYGADRWFNNSSSGTGTMSRQSFALGDTLGSNNPTFFLRQSVSGQSAAGDYAQFIQRIEGVRSYSGQTITVLGWARRSSGSGNMAVELVQDFGTGGSPSSSAFITPQTVTLTSSWAPFAVTIAVSSITGKTLGTNGNDNLALNFWTSAGSTFAARTNSLGLQTIGVDLWGIHIKVGTHTAAATDRYRQPELGPELARCQRYFIAYGGLSPYERFGVGLANSTIAGYPIVFFPTEMRISPAVSSSATALWNGSSVIAATAVITDSGSTKAYSLGVQVSSGLTMGASVVFLANNNLNARLHFDAEL